MWARGRALTDDGRHCRADPADVVVALHQLLYFRLRPPPVGVMGGARARDKRTSGPLGRRALMELPSDACGKKTGRALLLQTDTLGLSVLYFFLSFLRKSNNNTRGIHLQYVCRRATYTERETHPALPFLFLPVS